LATTAWSEQGKEFAVADCEIDAVYSGNALVVNADRTEFDTRFVGRGCAGGSLMVRLLRCFDLQHQVLSCGQRRETPLCLRMLWNVPIDTSRGEGQRATGVSRPRRAV